jgi:hypothetical protein
MTISFKIITHAIQLMTIIACIRYLVFKKSLQPYLFFSIGWIIILLFDLAMVTVGLIYPKNNNWIYNIAFPLQQLFIMYFFTRLLENKNLYGVMSLFGLFAVFNLLFWQGRITLNTYSLALGGIIIVLFAFFKIFRLYRTDSPQSLYSEPAFWICTGFIVYWGMGSPFFAMYNFLWESTPSFFIIYFYTVNFGFTILLNLSIIKALQCSLITQR